MCLSIFRYSFVSLAAVVVSVVGCEVVGAEAALSAEGASVGLVASVAVTVAPPLGAVVLVGVDSACWGMGWAEGGAGTGEGVPVILSSQASN